MQFNRSQNVSFKTPDEGDYIGVLIGFCYVGYHDTQDWGPRPKCMLRWELHDLNAPHALCEDDEHLPFVATQNFPATVQGESSWLYKCLVAHGIAVPGGGVVDSHSWHGYAAKLEIEHYPGKNDRVYTNVVAIKPLDQEVKIKPALNYEHWEATDTAPPPGWAKSAIERSNDLSHRVLIPGGQTGGQTGGHGTGQRAQAPAQPASGASSGGGGYRAPEHDDDEIPF